MTHSDSQEGIEGRLDQAFADYQDRLDRNEAVDLAAFLAEYPDCAAALREEIEDDRYARTLVEGSPDVVVRARQQPSETNSRRSQATPAGGDSPLKSWPATPRILGDYELLGPRARGGMGVVYKARQRSLNRIVALKVIADGEFATASAVTRFRSEAEAAARLKHSHIVAIHEIGDQDGLCYFSMDYIHGRSLAEVLQDGPLPPRKAAEYVACIAQTIEYAHQQGLLHRDVKPSNVLIDEHDQPLLTDFGLARSLDSNGDLTQTGEIVGTAGYMSPEQSLPGRSPLGPQCDVYSLGALLYALLVGRPPFQADSPLDTLLQVRESDPVAPRSLNPKIPRDLETICLKCLEKSTSRRYSSARALAEDLERFLRAEPIAARPVRWPERTWRWCSRHRAAATTLGSITAAIVTVVVSLATYAVHTRQLNEKLAYANSDLTDTQSNLLATQGKLQSALNGLSELAERQADLLYVADIQLAAKAIGDGDLRQAGELLNRCAPGDGEADQRGLEWTLLKRKLEVDEVTLSDHDGNVYTVRYSPDGAYLASAGEDGTVRFYDTETHRLLWTLETGQGEVNGIAITPDSGRIASAGDDGTVRLWDIGTGAELYRINAHEGLAFQVAFTPDGKLLLSCGNDEHLKIWDAVTGAARGTLGTHQGMRESFAISSDGRYVASAGKEDAAIWELATGRSIFSRSPSYHTRNVSLSPSGWIAWAVDFRADLDYMDDAGNIVPGGPLEGFDRSQAVAFSRDGKWGADGSRGGVVTLWPIGPVDRAVLAEQGQRPWSRTKATVQHWQAHTGTVWWIDFAPNGKHLATAGADGTVRLWPLDSRQFDRGRRTLPNDVVDCVWLSDGRLALSRVHEVTCWDVSGEPPTLAAEYLRQEGAHNVITAFQSAGSQKALIALGDQPTGVIRLLDASDGSRVGEWFDDKGRTVDWLGNVPGAPLLFAKLGGHLVAFDLPSLTPRDDFSDVWCNAVTVSNRGRWLAFANRGSDTIELWDLWTMKQMMTLDGHSSSVDVLSFSPDDRSLASGGDDRYVKIWDVASGRCLHELLRHHGPVSSLLFTPDNRRLLTTGTKGVTHIWSFPSGQHLLALDSTMNFQSVPDNKAILSPDGAYLARKIRGKIELHDLRPVRESPVSR